MKEKPTEKSIPLAKAKRSYPKHRKSQKRLYMKVSNNGSEKDEYFEHS